jgi:hypothetical protein
MVVISLSSGRLGEESPRRGTDSARAKIDCQDENDLLPVGSLSWERRLSIFLDPSRSDESCGISIVSEMSAIDIRLPRGLLNFKAGESWLARGWLRCIHPVPQAALPAAILWVPEVWTLNVRMTGVCSRRGDRTSLTLGYASR